ncbi:MAG: sigma factor, partial [Myxococcota bacterium]
MRREYGRIIALLARNLQGNLALAEDSLQAAVVAALEQWERRPPAQPVGWLIRTARHKAIDTVRRQSTWTHKARLLAAATDDEAWMPDLAARSFPAERLRLICTCCHPAL